MHQYRRVPTWGLMVLNLGWQATVILAAVTPTGDTTVGSTSYVGKDDAGTLTIDAGSSLSGISAYCGYNAGAVGTALVTGAGSMWSNVGTFYIGYSGHGTLSIEAGGEAISTSGFIGHDAGSAGTVSVMGPGSTWINSGTVYLGTTGAGTVTVSEGGVVKTKTLYASMSDLLGNGTITVSSGAVLDANLVFDATHGTSQAISFGNGGTLNLTIDGTSDLGVGHRGVGSLRIADGVAVSSASGYLGDNTGSTGTATVAGAGSKWNNSGPLYLGHYGQGTLLIEGGGRVSSSDGYVGYYRNESNGIAAVSGTGSTWVNRGALYISNLGTGTLTVSDGGLVKTKSLYASLADLQGNGTIAVSSGAVLDANLVFDAAHGATQTISFGTGGTLNLEVNGSSILGVGYKANGNLMIADGVVVSSASGYLGYNTGSTGTAVVTGTGTRWSNTGNLYIGSSGTGILTVSDGGLVTAKTLYASLDDLAGNGTIVTSGAVFDANLVFDAMHGTAQAISFGSGGTLNLTLGASSIFGVGYKGVGNLRIADGVAVSSASGYLGFSVGSTGTATVTGTGSKWNSSDSLYLGSSGSGTLIVEAGGQVSDLTGYLGFGPGRTGVATVTGAGSKWSNSGPLYVGYRGNGTLNVEAGGQVASSSGIVSSIFGGIGSVRVSGTESTWINSGALYVGDLGAGTLTVSDGGLVKSKTLYASLADLHGNGMIMASGGVFDANLAFDATHGTAQSISFGTGGTLSLTLDASSVLGVGYKGTGSLYIAEGAMVSSAFGYLGFRVGSTGAATVTGTDSKWANSGTLYVGNSGVGSLTVSDGAQVTTKILFASLSRLFGNGSITITSGALLDADLVFDASHGTTQAISFGTGGTLTLTVDGSSVLGVGYKSGGSLRIIDGVTVSSTQGFLGYSAGSSGTAAVTGAGSRWAVSDSLSIGGSGSGTLTIEAGAQVSDATASIGSSQKLQASTARICGNGSTWTSSGSLRIGAGGTAAMTIEAGGEVVSASGLIGDSTGSTGTVSVTGPGAAWTNSGTLYVGKSGAGTLTVSEGGVVKTKTLYASMSDLLGNGTITVSSGAVLDANLVFDATHGTTQAISFGNGGTLNLTIDGTSDLGVGHRGVGSLRIADSVVVSSASGYLGYNTGSTGTATVTGTGAKWNDTGSLYVGYYETGTLNVEGGAWVAASSGYVGYTDRSTGTATVTGANSTWSVSNELYVGMNGTGTLSVLAGGQVKSSSGYIGHGNGSSGTVAVRGTGSSWACGDLHVGDSGDGGLVVSNGGSLSVKTLYASLIDLSGDGTITASGAVLDGNLVFDGTHGSPHEVAFGTGGVLSLSIGRNSILGVGHRLNGSLHVTGGASVDSATGFLGSNSGSIGVATVSGTGSRWSNYRDLYVGFSGAGRLCVEAGGEVSSATGYIGYSSGSTGAATVTGIGSKWTINGPLYVGSSRNGTLLVSNGGMVITKTLYASLSDVLGNGSITANGAVLDANLVFDQTHGATQSVAFGSGGILNLSINRTGDLGVGQNTSGSLMVAGGIGLSSARGYLGYRSGSTGSATVTGPSKWTNDSYLYVGYSGSGVLNIEAGGQVSNSTGYVASGSGSSGVVRVTGTGSRWTNNGNLYVGYSGTGTLTIEAGGQVISSAGYVGNDTRSNATAIVTGTNAKWTNSGSLYVRGTLSVDAGGKVSSGNGYIGGGQNCSVAVNGINSEWTSTGSLYVGSSGNGTLSVSDGGLVTAKTLYASLGDLRGNGTIKATGGAVLDTDLAFDGNHGTTQSINFGNGGKLNLTSDVTGELGTGYRGIGSLRVAEGVAVSSSSGYLGYSTGSTGSGTITGPGSRWNNSGSLYAGYSGTGILNIEDGGQVSSGSGYLGANGSSTGAVSVTGTGSMLTVTGSLYVGNMGRGTLTVSDGGAVVARTLYASKGDLFGNGLITITGGALLDADLEFDATHGTTQAIGFGNGGILNLSLDGASVLGVGYKGNGNMRIAEGVVVSSASGCLGHKEGSAGVAVVTGAGSKWTNSDSLNVGYYGQGTLIIEAGGQVADASGNLGFNSAAISAALVTGIGSKWTNSSSLSLSGTLRIEAGGQVTSNDGYIGENRFDPTAVIVNGAGSEWINSRTLYVGHPYAGTLTVSEGGVVRTKALYASMSDLLGNGTITVSSGAVLDANLVFDATHGTTQAISFGNGGTLNLTIDGTSELGVGHRGVGSLRIADGVVVSSASGYLGYNTGSTGTATVTGAGSKWNSGPLFVGYYGSGSLNVDAGGQVDSADAYVAYSTNSSVGSVRISGAGSKWITNSLEISGTLTVEAGGQLTSRTGHIYSDINRAGAVDVTGSGSGWTNSGSLNVDGALNIRGGGQVSSVNSYLGSMTNSSGAVAVTGVGSRFITEILYVGLVGTGTLTVADGGVTTTKSLYASLSDLQGNGVINVANGAILDTDLLFDSTHGTTQAISFGSGGTLNLTFEPTGVLGVGYKTTGRLRICEGVQVSSGYVSLGDRNGSTGTGTVAGSGSKWNSNGPLFVGYSGNGVLNIEDGGQVNNTNGYISSIVGSSGTATLRGSGSKWINSGVLIVGTGGTLTLTEGGQVSVGGNMTTSGNVTVGSGSNLTVTGAYAQNGGQTVIEGDLTVNQASGLTVSGGTFQIGNGANAGTVTTSAINNGGEVKFNHSGGAILAVPISGTGSLTHDGPGTTILLASSTYTGATTINAGKLQVDGSIASSSGVMVNGTSSKFVANSTQVVRALTITDGMAEIGLANNASGYKVLTTASLALTGSGTLQLHHGGLMLDYSSTSPIAAVKAFIIEGFHSGDWMGSGLTSSLAAAYPTDRAVGYAEWVDIGSPATFMGVAAPDATTVLVRATIRGDANLDGTVNFADLVALAQNYGSAGPDLAWSKGDFNYDGVVNFIDLVAVAQHYNDALPLAAATPGKSTEYTSDLESIEGPPVPEPGISLLLTAFAATVIRTRRRIH